jgi:hypothetical protein
MSDPPNEQDGASRREAASGIHRVRERAADHQWLHGGRREAEPDTTASEASPRPDAAPRVVVCDDGELNDVLETLRALDLSPLRVKPSQLEELLDWERPTHLFVTTVRVALSYTLTVNVSHSSGGPVSIAVADSDAQTLCTAMLRRGFRYVVRRPVHPDALRLLLMQVLYSGRERRLVTRFPFGAEVRWRSRWRRGSCAMTEISAHGCRLATTERFLLHSRVHLRVPAALAGARPLRLRGRVVRREVVEREGGRRCQIALQFEALSGRAQAHLDALLAERSSGPAAMRGGGAREAGSRSERRSGSGFRTLTAEPERPPLPTDELRQRENDRRRRRRCEWHQEVVALDEETARVLHVLIGTDLSPGGLRVEPHPLLRIGDRLKLALYDAGEAEPLLVEARVGRDDGRRGCGLIFENVPDDVGLRLESMVLDLPPVSALSGDDEKPAAVVVGEILGVEDGSEG